MKMVRRLFTQHPPAPPPGCAPRRLLCLPHDRGPAPSEKDEATAESMGPVRSQHANQAEHGLEPNERGNRDVRNMPGRALATRPIRHAARTSPEAAEDAQPLRLSSPSGHSDSVYMAAPWACAAAGKKQQAVGVNSRPPIQSDTLRRYPLQRMPSRSPSARLVEDDALELGLEPLHRILLGELVILANLRLRCTHQCTRGEPTL